MEIKFDYNRDREGCNYDTDIAHWGCCCTCVHRREVSNHCCNRSALSSDRCVCQDSLGFYVCTCFLAEDGFQTDSKLSISGIHGCCEMFVAKKSNLSPQDKGKLFDSLRADEKFKAFTDKMIVDALDTSCYDLEKSIKILNSVLSRSTSKF